MTNTRQANFILSFDFEIGWGDVTNPRWIKREKADVYIRLRKVLKEILYELDTLNLPATWATVGAMITSPENLTLDHLPEVAKDVVHTALKSAKTDSFDGRDLFEMLLSSKTKHSIASHSYSHIPFNYSGVDKHFVEKDLELSLDAFSNYGISTDRFVFPENTEGYYPELANAGFRVARVGADHGMISRQMYLLSTLVSAPPACKIELNKHGVSQHYGSMLFNMGAKKYHRLPFVYARALRGLKKASRENETLHIWAHPFNFAESSLQLSAFKLFLRKVASNRDAGKISISTM